MLAMSLAPLTNEGIPQRMFHLSSAHFAFICLWIISASFLSRAYESNLLASLVKVDLEKQPQTIQVY